jgi:DeoR/GlpR family transcriptional regulator of sugar metabolism
MKREARSQDEVTSPIYFKETQKVQLRAAEATGVSERTIRRNLKEREEHEEQGTSLATPGTKHNVPKRKTEIHNFDKCVVRRTIHNFYAQEV